MEKVYCFQRLVTEDCPAGITVSRRRVLPSGDFGITEYSWPGLTLWFVDQDEFTADERQAVYEAHHTAYGFQFN